MVPGKKMKNEALGNNMKKKEKGERKEKKRKRGRVIFFVNIWHTSVDNCTYINVTFHDPLRGKLAAGEKYKN